MQVNLMIYKAKLWEHIHKLAMACFIFPNPGRLLIPETGLFAPYFPHVGRIGLPFFWYFCLI